MFFEKSINEYFCKKNKTEIYLFVGMLIVWKCTIFFCGSEKLKNIISIIFLILSMITFFRVSIWIIVSIIKYIKTKKIFQSFFEIHIINTITKNIITKCFAKIFVKPKDIYSNKNAIKYLLLKSVNIFVSTLIGSHLSSIGISVNPITTILNISEVI